MHAEYSRMVLMRPAAAVDRRRQVLPAGLGGLLVLRAVLVQLDLLALLRVGDLDAVLAQAGHVLLDSGSCVCRR
jgi:hypothetical protein